MEITIKLLEESDVQALYDFERGNKAFFESVGFGRSESYYDVHNFKEIIKELVEEQNKDLVYMYLIKDAYENIVGRVNLTEIIRGNMNKAELGYRMGVAYQGKGYATKAVSLILERAAAEHKLHRIEAGTSADNIGSQVVLVKNGFQFTGRLSQYICINGEWQGSITFEKIIK